MARYWPGLLCGLALVLGCGGKPSESHVKPNQLHARLDACLTMTNLNARDEALKAVALDAAEIGEGEVVKGALGRFTSLNLKDEAASACALKLSAAGQDQAAVDVAKMMMSLDKRDDVLKKIAKGQH